MVRTLVVVVLVLIVSVIGAYRYRQVGNRKGFERAKVVAVICAFSAVLMLLYAVGKHDPVVWWGNKSPLRNRDYLTGVCPSPASKAPGG
jgi:CDP-diglyceride synthetase